MSWIVGLIRGTISGIPMTDSRGVGFRGAGGRRDSFVNELTRSFLWRFPPDVPSKWETWISERSADLDTDRMIEGSLAELPVVEKLLDRKFVAWLDGVEILSIEQVAVSCGDVVSFCWACSGGVREHFVGDRTRSFLLSPLSLKEVPFEETKARSETRGSWAKDTLCRAMPQVLTKVMQLDYRTIKSNRRFQNGRREDIGLIGNQEVYLNTYLAVVLAERYTSVPSQSFSSFSLHLEKQKVYVCPW